MNSRRRLPKQKRGKQKVTTVLKTAAKLFSTLGYEITTTRQISEIAGLPIGTIYQFFSNKKEILLCLAEYYGQRIEDHFETLMKSGIEQLDKNKMPEKMITFFFEFDKQNPEFYSIFNFASNSKEMREVTQILDEIIISRLGNVYKCFSEEFQPATSQLQLLTLYKTLIFLFLEYKEEVDLARKAMIKKEMYNLYEFYLNRLTQKVYL